MIAPLDVLKTLLEKMPFPAWIADETQTILYTNDAMREIFGNLAGEKTSIIYESTSFEMLRRTGDASDAVSEVLIADIPFFRFRCEGDFDEDGKYNIEIFRDISEQKLDHIKMKQALAKIRTETQTAQSIQKSVLPIDDTYWNTIAYSSVYEPADDLGGDFYDVLKLNEDEYLFYIADVSGHGIQASLLTIFMRERVRAHIETALMGTAELLEKLVQDFIALEIDNAMYITMVLCKYTKSERTLAISNAGHGCFPLIIRDNGRAETIPIRGMPISLIADETGYEEESFGMTPGDRLILFTDGIIEEVDSATGRSFGSEGVRKLAEEYHAYSGKYLAQKIMDESARYALVNAKDDRTIVVADILS